MNREKSVLVIDSVEARDFFDILHRLRIERQKRIVKRILDDENKQRKIKIPRNLMLG